MGGLMTGTWRTDSQTNEDTRRRKLLRRKMSWKMLTELTAPCGALTITKHILIAKLME